MTEREASASGRVENLCVRCGDTRRDTALVCWSCGTVDEESEWDTSLRDALAFYADEANWTQPTSSGGRLLDYDSAALADCGRRARAALAALTSSSAAVTGEDPS